VTNDLKLGGVDVADLRFGATQVSKVMLGSTEIWVPGGAPPPVPPALVDSFTHVDTTYASTSTYAIPVPVGKTIPAGSLLVVSAPVNGIMMTGLSMADNSASAGTANSYARRSADDWVATTNVGAYLWVCKTTRQINAGNTITFTHSGGARNRHTAVVAWFSGVFPDTTIDGTVIYATSSSAAWATGSQATPAANPTLDLVETIGTGATPPYGYGGGFTKIGEAATASGTSDRSGSLGYRVSPAAGTRSASGTCTSAVWGAGLAAINYTP